jgi:hypothetical protein
LLVLVIVVASHVDQLAEPAQVDVALGERDPVSPGPEGQPGWFSVRGGAEDPAQSGGVAVERAAGRRGRIVAPDPVDQRLGRQRASGVDEQGRQHCALLGWSQIDQPTGDPQLDRPEQLPRDVSVGAA